MSQIIGDHNPLVNFTLNPGAGVQVWWTGVGAYNIGFPFPSAVWTQSSRVVADSHSMDWSRGAGPSGIVYTVNLHAEGNGTGSPAAFRVQIGQLS
ncbi:hypothetical protein [Mycobacterium montefiorense]|uniref:hypothetical protein n=1 Tax=Mycobacterium montefiorense TaxID=154654 RepID=UPI0021F30A4B|nr:hypothetical protein [Mycobacterium montefiorense]MCV7426713.1 hypothetical protein [Mycobacterium montefiorense]GLE53454.1 hypothetical protein ATCCBAA256_30150 [Mycobacterium montefiorense]